MPERDDNRKNDPATAHLPHHETEGLKERPLPNSRKRRRNARLRIILACSSLVGSLVAFWAGIYNWKVDRERLEVTNVRAEEFSDLLSKAAAQGTDEARVKQLIEAAGVHMISQSGAKNESENDEILSIKNSQTDLNERMQKLESTILENPEKALAIPLLRRDLDAARASNELQRMVFREEIDRLYGLLKWISGLLGTVLLGVVGWATNTLIQSLRAPKAALIDENERTDTK
ncbi:hypothetical protein ACCQ07_05260 [Xanthomonas sp. NCPPB 3583]|uniref:hypothetical protein n=1 Tax=Xanthomonas sp. NCPPB 3583 TaxID=487558 RepID=UPI003557071F